MSSLKNKLATLVALVAIASPTLTVTLLTLSSTPPTLAQSSNTQETEAERLLNICRKNLDDKQFQLALDSCKQAATAHRK